MAAHCTDIGKDCCAPNGEAATCSQGLTPKRTQGTCFNFPTGSAFECCGPPIGRSQAMADLLDAFEEDGLLIHSLQGNSDWPNRLAAATTLDDVGFDTDCGAHCVALSLLHPQLPVQAYCPRCITLVFRAGADLWRRYVQCAAVTDSNSGNRACCACYEPQWCPFGGMDRMDSGYCASACVDPTDATCQALAAGCGFNLRDIGNDIFGTRKCSENQVKRGTCGLCTQPAWCDDGGVLLADGSYASPYGKPIDTLTLWQTKMEKQGVWLQDHQCKFRASQKDAFVATAHAHMKTQKRQGHVVGFSWNEVNFYSDGGIADGGFAAAMLRNLVGVMVIRENGQDWHQPDDRTLSAIIRQLARLNITVPKLKLRIGGHINLDEWDPTRSVNLRGMPYHLTEL